MIPKVGLNRAALAGLVLISVPLALFVSDGSHISEVFSGATALVAIILGTEKRDE